MEIENFLVRKMREGFRVDLFCYPRGVAAEPVLSEAQGLEDSSAAVEGGDGKLCQAELFGPDTIFLSSGSFHSETHGTRGLPQRERTGSAATPPTIL